jgi:ABC-type glycerol-3-phosphate transport system substrate-binding protein
MMRRLATALALLVVAAVGITGCGGEPQSPQATAPTTTSHAATPAPRQTVLPFAGLEKPHDVAVDNAGNVYIADTQNAKEDKDSRPAAG